MGGPNPNCHDQCWKMCSWDGLEVFQLTACWHVPFFVTSTHHHSYHASMHHEEYQNLPMSPCNKKIISCQTWWSLVFILNSTCRGPATSLNTHSLQPRSCGQWGQWPWPSCCACGQNFQSDQVYPVLVVNGVHVAEQDPQSLLRTVNRPMNLHFGVPGQVLLGPRPVSSLSTWGNPRIILKQGSTNVLSQLHFHSAWPELVLPTWVLPVHVSRCAVVLLTNVVPKLFKKESSSFMCGLPLLQSTLRTDRISVTYLSDYMTKSTRPQAVYFSDWCKSRSTEPLPKTQVVR